MEQVCVADAASSGDADTDFRHQGVAFTIFAATITSVSPATVPQLTNTVVDVSAGGGAVQGDLVAFVPISNVGCLGAGGTGLQVSAGLTVSTNTTYTLGKYHLCVATAASLGNADSDFTQQPATIIFTAVTAATVANANPSTAVAGVGAVVDITGSHAAGDFVSFVLSAAADCTGAVAPGSAVTGSDTITVPTSLVAGTYKVCHATSASLGDNDNDYLEQGLTMTIVAATATSMAASNSMPTTWSAATDVVAAVGGATQGDFVAFVSTASVGCLGAGGAGLAVQAGLVIDSGTSLTADTYRVCYATAASSGDADSDYLQHSLVITVAAPTVTAFAAVNAAPLVIASGVDTTVDVIGAAVGDFIAAIPLSDAGCDGAGGNAVVVSAGNTVSSTTAISADTYRVCHAPAASLGDSNADFMDQGIVLTVSAAHITDVVPTAASSSAVAAGVDALLQLTQGLAVGTGDFVALVSTATTGCGGASAGKRTVGSGDVITAGTSLMAGTYKLCYADDATVGDADTDFVAQPASITVVATVLASLTSPNAMPTTATENVDVALTVAGGSVVDGDFVALVPADQDGCTAAHVTAARIFAVTSGTISLGTGVANDTWKACTATAASLGDAEADYMESSVTFTTADAELSAMVVLKAKPDTLAAGVSVAVDCSGANIQGDYIAFVAQSDTGCLGAGSTGFVVGAGNEVVVSVAAAGSYRTCYATAASGGDQDSDFRNTGLATVTVEAPSVTAVSVRRAC